jgi:hypothetical protein
VRSEIFCNILGALSLDHAVRASSRPKKERSGRKNMLSRRQMLMTGVAAGAALALPSIREAYAFAQSPTTIPLFGTVLRGISTIGVAQPDPTWHR